jgi:AraC-like DNA-binding protein
VDAALRHLIQYVHLHDRGGLPVLLHLDAKRVALGYAIYHPDMPGKSQVDDATIAIAFTILRQLCGANWRPIEVMFAHRAPADTTPYRRVFGPHVRFDAELSAVVFSAHWLDSTIDGADPAVREALLAAFRQAAARDTGELEERVRRALYSLAYLDGPASAPAVARLFGLHERQLRRRLTLEGTSWRQLAHEARREFAKHLLRDTRLPLTDIAAALHYSDAKGLSRAFRLWTGVTPGTWRASSTSSAHEVGDLPT